jgi:catechol 2,3-dioxygenase-like lactoylglutathione lyase family enzyme
VKSHTITIRAAGLLVTLPMAWLFDVPAWAVEPPVRGVDSVAMTVANIDASRAFFERVLDFEFVSDAEVSEDPYERLYGIFGLRLRTITLKLGDERLQLQQFIAPLGRPFPVEAKANDRSFQHVAIIVSDMDRAFARLREAHVHFASSSPQVLPAYIAGAAGIAAFYFRDPDGHFLEILHFPSDKGDVKWRQHLDRLFLGIDHTAIVVADTDASLGFYRDTLGMTVVGSSENFGPEQEHLNGVFGARLRITALRAAHGLGVELLEYLTPRDGSAMPADTHASDVWFWHINCLGDTQEIERRVRAHHYSMISPGVVAEAGALMVRDPDGHANLVQQSTRLR